MTTQTKSGNVPPGQEKKLQGTITGIEPFDKAADVAALQQMLRNASCETALADFLVRRSNQQRQEIREGYKEATGRELMQAICDVTSGKFQDVVVGLLDDSLQFAARCLYQAMKGLGTDEKALVDVLCTRNRNVETLAIKETFKDIYNVDLETMLKQDTSDPFLKLLLTVAAANRDEEPSADIETQARKDADVLFKAGEGRPSGSLDDDKFIEILATRPLIQLHLATFKFYDQKSKKGGIQRALESERCSDAIDGYLALVKTAKGELVEFYADRLHHAMKGMGTDDSCLIRTLISRSEIDLANIKDEFQAKYGQSLSSFVKDDTSGDYCNILVRILSGSPPAKP
ncbi:annexin A13-like [Acanthaster planci]|uniref:Annexin n=1 Tax=Acanthaster planci TaxID=133434 RepID=A0A8B7YAU0_ACAPL|nr:annexin A13-like [Acanthaster planci]